MIAFVLRRALVLVPMLVGIASLVFLLMYLAPGDSVGACLSEMGSIYRQARAGEMPWVDAWLAVKILEKIRLAVENSEYEQTLQALEAERGIGTARPNGSGYAAASRRAGPS